MATSHVNALQHKHAGLDEKIRDEQSRPAPDTTTVQALKKKKMRIKDELARG